ncbi:MAG: hypothetical protein P4N59_29715 [Negativicutes bacterium]|nr:hypothetical protein [Negativicutes bacterium]
MEIRDLHLKGTLLLTLKKEDGSVEVRRKDNIIVNSGFDFICAQVAGAPAAVMQAIALGTGNSSPVASQTTLATELARQAATYAHTNGTQTFTLSSTFGPGVATGAITEAGVFNSTSASSGTMLDRVTFSVINKGASDTLTAQFQFTLS